MELPIPPNENILLKPPNPPSFKETTSKSVSKFRGNIDRTNKINQLWTLLYKIDERNKSKKLNEFGNYLKENSEYINDINEDGYTPLTYSIEKIDYDLVKLLIDNGADVNEKDENGMSPLYMLGLTDVNSKEYENVSSKYEKIANILIKNGANINEENLLHTFAANNDIKILELLIDKSPRKNIYVNKKNSEGYTALYYAIANKNYEACEILINNEANIFISNSENAFTFLPLLIDKDNEENNKKIIKIAELLLNRYKNLIDKPDVSASLPLNIAIDSENNELIQLYKNVSIKKDTKSEYPGSKKKSRFWSLLNDAIEKDNKVTNTNFQRLNDNSKHDSPLSKNRSTSIIPPESKKKGGRKKSIKSYNHNKTKKYHKKYHNKSKSRR